SRFKELEGYQVVRLGLFDGERLTGGAVGYAFPSPAEAGAGAGSPGPGVRSGAGGARAPPARAGRGPRRSAGVRRARGAGAGAPRVERGLPLEGAEGGPAPLRGLARSPVDLVPVETLEVELGPEAGMLGRMKPKGRYNARLAQRRGVEVVTSTDPADVHGLHFVLEQTAGHQDFLLESKRFFINLAQALMPGMARFAFARYKGITLAAGLPVRHRATVTSLTGGQLPLFPEVMASHALHWHIMREAAAEGYRVYDFYGYAPPDRPRHPYAGFSRFKEKFGGRHVRRIGSHDVVFYDRL